MITDLEMKGTLRGALQTFNQRVNLHSGDGTAQECIRTFLMTSFPGSAFLHRLELELDGMGAECVSARIPLTRRPSDRSKNAQAPAVDVYGFRGADARVVYL